MADSVRSEYEGLDPSVGGATNTGTPGEGDGTGLIYGGLDAAMDRVEKRILESDSPLANFGDELPGSPPRRTSRAEEDGESADEGEGSDDGPEEEETGQEVAQDDSDAEGSDVPSDEPQSPEDLKSLADALRVLKRDGYTEDEISEMGRDKVLALAEKRRPLQERTDQAYQEREELKRRLSEAEKLIGHLQTGGHQAGDKPNGQTNLSELASSFASEADLDPQAASTLERLLVQSRGNLEQENSALREMISGLQEGLQDTYWDRAEGLVAREIPELQGDPKLRAAVMDNARAMADLQGLSAKEALDAMRDSIQTSAQAALYGRTRDQQSRSERRAHKQQGQPRSSGRRGQKSKPKGFDAVFDSAFDEVERKHGIG